jgi:hypothetical protein
MRVSDGEHAAGALALERLAQLVAGFEARGTFVLGRSAIQTPPTRLKYISLVILHTNYTKRHLNDSTAHA